MDVRNSVNVVRLFFAFAALFVFGCNQKSVSEVFPESSQKPGPACAAERVSSQFIVSWKDGRITNEKSVDENTFIDDFLKPNLEEIERVEFDKKIELQPQDIYRPMPDGAVPVPSENWGIDKIHAREVWDAGYRGAGVKVAVVDTPVDVHHPQLKSRVEVNLAELNGAKGVDDDGNGFVDDVYGWDFFADQPMDGISEPSEVKHGSHVSGIILADPSAGSVEGVAPEAHLVATSFIKSDSGGGYLSGGITAMKAAADRGAKIINASWGGGACSTTLKTVMSTLAKKDVLIVVAAGNNEPQGLDLDRNPVYPAAFNLENQVTVAASNSNDRIASFSNTSFALVHLAAPGVGIVSTVPLGTETMDGTSMAAPFVAGAAAVLMGAKPSATLSQIRYALLKGVDVPNNSEFRVQTDGRLNLKKSLDYLLSQP